MSRGHKRTTSQEKIAWLLARQKDWEGFPPLGEWPRGELNDRILRLTDEYKRDLLSPTTYRLDARGSMLTHIVLARKQRRENTK